MNILYPYRWPIIVFLVGFLIRMTGVLMKIRHWPNADELITIGFVIAATGLVWLIIKLAILKKN